MNSIQRSCFLGLALLVASPFLTGAATSAAEEVRVGTYDLQRVFQAMQVGDQLQQRMMGLQTEAQQAQEEGDQARLQELQGRAQRLQQEVIEDFRNKLEGASSGVADRNDVQVIVADIIYVGPDAEIVDLTDDLIQTLRNDSQ